MIKLALGKEPAELTAQRNKHLPTAIATFNRLGVAHEDFKKLLDRGYRVARTALHERQYGKCAFCEQKEDAFKRPVEHFRPKKIAQDFVNNAWVGVDTHYWWLAWTWENLLFACDHCNMTGNKGSRFPIETGSVRVIAPVTGATHPLPDAYFDTSGESPLLVNPRIDNPLDHIQWLPVDRTKPKRRWKWTVVGRDRKGDMTLKVLSLGFRLDDVNDHLDSLLATWHHVEGHLKAGRWVEAQDGWNDLIGTYVSHPRKPFRSAAWWALDALCSHNDRVAYNLKHPIVPSVTGWVVELKPCSPRHLVLIDRP